MYARRNSLRDETAALCVEAGLAVKLEKGVLVHGLDNSPLAADFSVVHPLQPADLAEMRRILRLVHVCLLVVAWAGSFCGFFVEALGAWGGKAQMAQMP